MKPYFSLFVSFKDKTMNILIKKWLKSSLLANFYVKLLYRKRFLCLYDVTNTLLSKIHTPQLQISTSAFLSSGQQACWSSSLLPKNHITVFFLKLRIVSCAGAWQACSVLHYTCHKSWESSLLERLCSAQSLRLLMQPRAKQRQEKPNFNPETLNHSLSQKTLRDCEASEDEVWILNPEWDFENTMTASVTCRI